jgi:flagellin
MLKLNAARPDRGNEPAEKPGHKGGDNPTRLNPTQLTNQENAGREAGNITYISRRKNPMSMTINTNVASLNGQRNLANSQNKLNNSLQRLSSGLRINSAKDDAAGLAISSRMDSQVRGMNQAARNANDGISMAQTAEGALQESTSILQRIRELAVQSANDTNTASDRASMQAEVEQLTEELQRISETTQFNGKNLLDGTLDNAVFQVGANAGTNQTISFGIDSTQTANLSAVGTIISAPNGTAVAGETVTGTDVLDAGALVVNGKATEATASGSAYDIAAAINTAAGGDTPIATAVNVQAIAFDDISLADGSEEIITASVIETGDAGSDEVEAKAAEQTFDFSNTTVANGASLTFDVDGQIFSFDNNTGAALSGSALVAELETDLDGTAVGDSGLYHFVQDGATATLTVTQAVGNEKPLEAIETTNTSAIGAPTGTTEPINQGATGSTEDQSIDITGLTVADGGTLTFSYVDSDGATQNLVYTNDTFGDALSGAGLAADIDRAFSGNAQFSFDQNAGTTTQLDITQNAGYFEDIGAIEISAATLTTRTDVPTASEVVAGDAEVVGSATQTQAGGADTSGTFETQEFVLSDLKAGQTISFSIDGVSADFTNDTDSTIAAADLGDALVAYDWGDGAGVIGTGGTANGSTYTLSNAGATLTVTQSVGEADVADMSVTTTTFEVQSFDFSGESDLEAGANLTFTVDGEDFSFTNSTGSDIAAADIAAWLDGQSDSHLDGETYTFADSGAGVATLIQSGATTEAKDIGLIEVTNESQFLSSYDAAVNAEGVEANLEFQSLDFSATTVEAGETLTFSIDGQDVIYENEETTALSGAALVSDIETYLGSGHDIGNSKGTYTFEQNAGTTTRLDVYQDDAAYARDIDNITTVNSSSGGNPTGEIVEDGVEYAAEVVAVAAQQTIDFDDEDVFLDAGRTMELDVAGETLTFTNDTDERLTGAALAEALATSFGGGEEYNIGAVGEANNYTFEQGGVGEETKLVITQAAGNESAIAGSEARTPGELAGTYVLELNGEEVNVTAATADATVTADEIAAAINDVEGFSATTNDDGAVVITKDDGDNFTLREVVDSDGTLPIDDLDAGLTTVGDTAVVYQGKISLDSTANITLSGDGLSATGLADVGSRTTTIDQLDISTVDGSTQAISSVDAALQQINEMRGAMGAVQSRFESTINNLQSASENISAARSRIVDADFASETAELTKAQILQQAGTAMLAQANQLPQAVLGLLQ